MYQIIHTLYGNYCHSNARQTSQLEEMGNDACIFVGFHDKVINTVSLNKLFETLIMCSKSFFSDSEGCRRRKYGSHEKSKPNRIRYKKVFRQIFPPKENDILYILQSDNFKAFLMTDATASKNPNKAVLPLKLLLQYT